MIGELTNFSYFSCHYYRFAFWKAGRLKAISGPPKLTTCLPVLVSLLPASSWFSSSLFPRVLLEHRWAFYWPMATRLGFQLSAWVSWWIESEFNLKIQRQSLSWQVIRNGSSKSGMKEWALCSFTIVRTVSPAHRVSTQTTFSRHLQVAAPMPPLQAEKPLTSTTLHTVHNLVLWEIKSYADPTTK